MDGTVIDVTSWPLWESGEASEGRRSKSWVREPGESEPDAPPWLFKSMLAVENERQYEEWAEPVISRLGRLLGVPCAEILWASRGAARGALARNVRPSLRWELMSGATWMERRTGRPLFPEGEKTDTPAEAYTIEKIKMSLEGVGAPPQAGVELHGLSAFDIFAGYLVLDALSSCPDRHGENWAVLIDPSATEPRLAAMYDFEGRLGGELTHEQRRGLAESEPMFEAYRRTHRPWFFHWVGSTPTLVQTATIALELGGVRAQEHWRSAIEGLSAAQVEELIELAPDIEPDLRHLAGRLITANLSDLRRALSPTAG